MIEDMQQEMARIGIDVSHQQIADLLLAVSGDTFLRSVCLLPQCQVAHEYGG